MKNLLFPLLFLIACTAQQESTITSIETPALSQSAEPSLFTDKSGITYLSWIEKKDSVDIFKYSTLENDQWSKPIEISASNNWFVNWADYPMFSANGEGKFASHILRRSADGKFTYDVDMLLSTNGIDWKTVLLNTDNKQAEHGFVTHIPYGENIFVTWLDGRNTVMEGMENMGNHEGHHGVMSIRAAVLDYEGNRINEWELDNKTCDCCQTTAAITDNGPIVIYRDRSDEEIRDMSIVRLVNNEWTTPKKIFNDHWKIAGCPVNGPRVAAIGNTLAVAWFAAPDNKAQVKVTFSHDGGETFQEPIQIDEGNPIGRVDIVMIDKANAFVSWMEGTDIRFRKVSSNMKLGQPETLANSSSSRSSGFPQMELSKDKLIFAWTDDSLKVVRTARVDF